MLDGDDGCAGSRLWVALSAEGINDERFFGASWNHTDMAVEDEDSAVVAAAATRDGVVGEQLA